MSLFLMSANQDDLDTIAYKNAMEERRKKELELPKDWLPGDPYPDPWNPWVWDQAWRSSPDHPFPGNFEWNKIIREERENGIQFLSWRWKKVDE